MGLVYKGLPTDLVDSITKEIPIDLFVETGTFMGDSLAAAAEIFPQCYSIEIAEELYQKAVKRFEGKSNAHVLLGSSVDKISEIDFSTSSSALFWLDAHYSGGDTGGEGFCPLIDELKLISSLSLEKYVMIDDARCILSPCNGHRYCTLEQLIDALPKGNYNVIINDIVISVPQRARKPVEDYCAKHTLSRPRKIRSKRVRKLIKSLVGEL